MKTQLNAPSTTESAQKLATGLESLANDPVTAAQIADAERIPEDKARQMAATQKPAPSAKPQKLAKNVPHPDIPSSVPLKFQGMLHQCWMMLRANPVTDTEEIRLRQRTADFWVDMNARDDQRFDVLVRLAEETRGPALMVTADFRPEALNEAAMRHLRTLKEMGSPVFVKALSKATSVDLVSGVDVSEFFTK